MSPLKSQIDTHGTFKKNNYELMKYSLLHQFRVYAAIILFFSLTLDLIIKASSQALIILLIFRFILNDKI